MCEAYKRVHQCKLPRMIELEARNAFSGRCDGRFRELSQLTAINEGFQNVLLDVEVVIVDLRQRFLESRQIFDGFVDAVIVDVIARGLGPQDDVIANVLLDEAVAIVAANHRIWKVYVLDLGLQFAPILLGDLATEDHGDLIRLLDADRQPDSGVKNAYFWRMSARTPEWVMLAGRLARDSVPPRLTASLKI